MRFNEIGQQLRAYRMESGLKAEEISARLGVSRAALAYRYEKGEVIKLDTVNRLAELLKISPLTLLGIGVEYYAKPIGYMERIRQIEETSDQILQVFGPICYLISSDRNMIPSWRSSSRKMLKPWGRTVRWHGLRPSS